MHLFNVACIAAVFILTFSFVSADDDDDDDDQQFYQQMREKAKDCEPGTIIKNDGMCANACKCVMTGVIKCDPSVCTNSDKTVVDDNTDSKQVDVPEPEENTSAPVDEPDEETTEAPVDEGNNTADSVYKQLRDDATGCKPGKAVPTDECAGCTCILPGVMRCTDINCLLPKTLALDDNNSDE